MGRDPYEVEAGRLVQCACELLRREMDEVFQDLVHRLGTDFRSPYRLPAECANRIVVLCDRLIEQIQRYASGQWHEEELEWLWGDDTIGERDNDGSGR